MSDVLKGRIDTSGQVSRWIESMKTRIATQPLNASIFTITHNPIQGYVINVWIIDSCYK